VLVRHGQTAWNAERRAQGQADVTLDDTGRAQAEEMATRVAAAYDPVLIVSSDLARARETAAMLEKETGLTATEDPRLREYDVGERTGLTYAEIVERDMTLTWATYTENDVHGGETTQDVAARVVPAVQEALAGLAPGETGVLVLHGACLRVALAGMLDWPLQASDGLAPLDNCGWAVLQEAQPDRVVLAAYNLTARGPDPD
jgi:broad specificity phosphatase PhoE